MKSRSPKKKQAQSNQLLLGLVVTGLFCLIVFLVYVGSLPTKYNLSVNDVSKYDIVAPRNVIDHKKTEELANSAMAQIPRKMLRSEDISQRATGRVNSLLALVEETRSTLYADQSQVPAQDPGNTSSDQDTTTQTEESLKPVNGPASGPDIREKKQVTASDIAKATTGLVNRLNQNFQLDFGLDMAKSLLEMSDDRFAVLKGNTEDAAKLIMRESLDSNQLSQAITDQVKRYENNQDHYAADLGIAQQILTDLLEPNIEYDELATENARQDAYQRVINNPIMINRGYRIVSQGDTITKETYDLLKDLDLTDDGRIDWRGLLGIAFLTAVVMAVLLGYLLVSKRELIGLNRQAAALIVSFLAPLLISRYLAQSFPLSSPVYFTTVVITAYFGIKMALVFSLGLAILVLPMTLFNPYFLPVVLVGSLVTALFTRGISQQDNYAKLILATSTVNMLTSVAISLIQYDLWLSITTNVISAVIAGSLSVVAAIGIMPLFEMMFNTVSPLRLVELSQPGHPLLKRLFMEAPGTSQHSITVATLSDNAAEAIGANSLICRVGSYYHDIGKLENPLMFTENQEGINPHKNLKPEESAAIILAHPEDGYEMGKKFNLPDPILEIIQQHHGTTVLQYFYHQACEQAKKEDRPLPDIELFTYRTPKPSSKESAVVMLADSVEAAMKSSGANNLQDAEELMRSIFKIKNEQDQLVESGLSYSDVEKILQAFLKVYAGQFHGRIQYPSGSDESIKQGLQAKVRKQIDFSRDLPDEDEV